MKISFIATVFNEEENIDILMRSLLGQTKIPDEVIIIDGGSHDTTVERIKSYSREFEHKKVRFVLLTKKGNRSVGRNEAIKLSAGNIVVCSDAGCILDKKWVEFITDPYLTGKADVVAGYYKGKSNNVFQKCLIPYVLVMPDKVDPNNFLPATRSMAFRKLIWEKIGGFPEKYSHNEDYVFAHRIKKLGTNIIFEKNAIVEWVPPSTFIDAFKIFFRFALGDAEARIFRPKVVFIFLRYILGILLLFYAIIKSVNVLLIIVFALIIFYCIWAVAKSYKYIKDVRATLILPILQIGSDFAVMIGTIVGLIKIWDTKKM